MAGLGLTDEQSDRATSHILQQVECARHQWIHLFLTIMLFIMGILLAVIVEAARPMTALQAMLYNARDWVIVVIVAMGSGKVIFVQRWRHRLQRKLFATEDFSPYAEKQLQRYIDYIDTSVLHGLPAYLLRGRI